MKRSRQSLSPILVALPAAAVIACLTAGLFLGAPHTEAVAHVAPTQKPSAAVADTPEARLISTAKDRVAHDFLDPSSAQFRETALFRVGGVTNVCGETNGKNLQGAYVGFRPFAYETSSDQAETWSPSSAEAYRAFSKPVCRNISLAGLAQERRSAQLAEDARHHETPIPAGYSVMGVVKYADTTVDPLAQAAAHAIVDGGVLYEEVEGVQVKVLARKSFAIRGGRIVVGTGQHGECHGCSGVVQLYYWRDVGAAKSFDEVGPPKIAGSWGQAPEVILYSSRDPKDLTLYMRLTTEFMQHGCTEKEGQLFKVDRIAVEPAGDPYAVDEGCS